MLDASRKVTQFMHSGYTMLLNCEILTSSVDCSYDIVQLLLHICMPTNTSKNFQATLHSTSSICRNILRLLTDK